MSGMSGSFSSIPLMNSCERLTFETTLFNPEMAILPTLSIGMKLAIIIDSNRGVVAVTDSQIVGDIQVEANVIDKLIKCIDGGTIYVGEIISLDAINGKCVVRVLAV